VLLALLLVAFSVIQSSPGAGANNDGDQDRQNSAPWFSPNVPRANPNGMF
jgi:hypothetical protein